jgi:hypothetical protein
MGISTAWRYPACYEGRAAIRRLADRKPKPGHASDKPHLVGLRLKITQGQAAGVQGLREDIGRTCSNTSRPEAAF